MHRKLWRLWLIYADLVRQARWNRKIYKDSMKKDDTYDHSNCQFTQVDCMNPPSEEYRAHLWLLEVQQTMYGPFGNMSKYTREFPTIRQF